MRLGILGASAALALTVFSTGCATVASSMPSANNVTGEAWYTENTGIGMLTFSSRVWYCPPADGPGAITCVEAKLVEEGAPDAKPAQTASAVAAPPPPAESEPPPPPPDEKPRRKHSH